ncbi:hypothetical protein BV25DRAFT_268089 [Artomyces pyxidatus]|uniref:Uncharacterized protein n=1 Tax=Artomyces pyxidatus TaxID=48021 RepID=A0ACB8T7Y1_9AGAM|nr:hypothetical protein BV25DRAFT_268089 [Artomyces pyxidatus]
MAQRRCVLYILARTPQPHPHHVPTRSGRDTHRAAARRRQRGRRVDRLRPRAPRARPAGGRARRGQARARRAAAVCADATLRRVPTRCVEPRAPRVRILYPARDARAGVVVAICIHGAAERRRARARGERRRARVHIPLFGSLFVASTVR